MKQKNKFKSASTINKMCADKQTEIGYKNLKKR